MRFLEQNWPFVTGRDVCERKRRYVRAKRASFRTQQNNLGEIFWRHTEMF